MKRFEQKQQLLKKHMERQLVREKRTRAVDTK